MLGKSAECECRLAKDVYEFRIRNAKYESEQVTLPTDDLMTLCLITSIISSVSFILKKFASCSLCASDRRDNMQLSNRGYLILCCMFLIKMNHSIIAHFSRYSIIYKYII